jgi:hypothetical protein
MTLPNCVRFCARWLKLEACGFSRSERALRARRETRVSISTQRSRAPEAARDARRAASVLALTSAIPSAGARVIKAKR